MEFVRLHSADNVVVAKVGLPAGIELISLSACRLRDDIPAMHKFAIRPIREGEEIIKYGQVIGWADRGIESGEHVHTHNCVMGQHEKNYAMGEFAEPVEIIPIEKRPHFMGYRRANGKAGTRNFIGILTSVNCSATVAKSIAGHFSNSVLKKYYPNVDGVIALTHSSGCGMSNEGPGYDILQRTLNGYARHPNFAGVLLIGLGCEAMQIKRLKKECQLEENELFRTFNIQDSGGTRASINSGISLVEELLVQANRCQRVQIDAGDLSLAVQCGGSDAFSGFTANPSLGVASDLLVKNGGTVIYSETPEIFGAEHLLTRRSASVAVAEKLLERIRWWEEYTLKHGVNLNNNPSPGNKTGGLTTILEKSLGAQSKGGSTPLNAVYLYAEEVLEKGLVFMDGPGFDPVSVTGQVASGANIICFTTGRGSAFGFKPSPSIKLSSNTALYNSMKEDIDVNCGSVLDGELTVEQCGEIIFEKILTVASGQQTKSEIENYGNHEFIPWHLGAVI